MYNKIGFHAGPDGNHNGIGEYYRRLDAAGVPFVIKSVDHYGHIYEACQYDNAPHVRVFRLSRAGQGDGYDYDVPDYSLSPEAAAQRHFERTRDKLPPEIDFDKVWIEPINEVDKNRSDWLGRFACAFGELSLAAGWRVLQFAWSSGEPEIWHWETPGMLAYLEMCARHPNRLGVALHEYSYDASDIWRLRGDLVGRFTRLFDVCDERGIRRPNVVITEWGWALNDLPRPAKAMQHIREVSELYAEYPQILGAAIWYLGGGGEWNDICDKAQKLIVPVTDYSFAAGYEPTEPPDDRHKAVVVKAPQEVTEAEWLRIAKYAHGFRHSMVASHDDALTMVRGGNSESYVKVTYPERRSQREFVSDLDLLGIRWQAISFDTTEPPPPPPPPTGPTIDLLPYVMPENGRQYIMRSASGSQERYYPRPFRDGHLIQKNGQGEYYEADDNYIYLVWDTTPNATEYYVRRAGVNDHGRAAYLPRRMAVGRTWTAESSHYVEFFRKSDCRTAGSPSEGTATQSAMLLRHYPTYTTAQGATYNDVIEIDTRASNSEIQVFARGIGRVEWRGHGFVFAATPEDVSGQQPMSLDLPNCL